ncbi:MAG: hypothetical protein WC711_00015 [Candidatus Staskawiczbacteria bacterium]|jgi:hypothetical protein
MEYKSENKDCQNCKQDFIVEPDDFAFYEKMKVPAPTWCPDCRTIRRMVWRNERTFYKRKCDATGVDMLSIIAPDLPYKVYETGYWRSDAWDPMSYGRDFDFSKPFFEQFNKLLIEIPHPNLVQKNVVDSHYAIGLNLKNCYFVFGSDGAEDSAYLFSPILRVKDCFDLHSVNDVEHCYDSVDIEKSSGLRFCQNCINCSDSWLLYDCRNCQNCFGCVGLRNKNYYIFNKSYSREDYYKELDRISPNTIEGLQNAKAKFSELKLITPRKYASIQKSDHVTGDDILNSKNCIYCFGAKNDTQNCKYGFRLINAKDGYDATIAWNGAEQFYEVVSVTAQRIIGSYVVWGGFDIEYSYNCYDCNNIFGCVGLRSKSYCILNKQYTKEEYEALVPEIILQMQKLKFKDSMQRIYSYGDFFPMEFSLYAYNETIAQDHFFKTKEEVSQMGLRWRQSEEKQYSLAEGIYECEHKGKCADHCAKAFRVVPQEMQFLKKMGIPLPHLCPFCRQAERIRLKNPLHLWHRNCMKSGCQNEFETPYSPERKEIIYCETCYNNEIV